MVIRISVQYLSSVWRNIAVTGPQEPRSSSISLKCLKFSQYDTLRDTLSRNYTKCFLHYSRWVFVSDISDFMIQQQFDDKIWWSTTTCQIQSIHHQSIDLLLSMHFWQELSNLEDRVFDAFYSYILCYGGISDQFPSPDCDAGCWDNVALNNQEMGSKRIVKLLRRSRREECRHILRLVRRQRF